MSIQRDANGMVQLDAAQVVRTTAEVLPDNAGLAQKVISVTGLVPRVFDEQDITYIVSGNGTGEIGTVVFKLVGVIVCTLNLAYDSSNRIINVSRS